MRAAGNAMNGCTSTGFTEEEESGKQKLRKGKVVAAIPYILFLLSYFPD